MERTFMVLAIRLLSIILYRMLYPGFVANADGVVNEKHRNALDEARGWIADENARRPMESAKRFLNP